MYQVRVESHYDSAHFLRNYRGKCERLHGHRYVVEAVLATEELDASGLAFDFAEIKKHLRALTDRLDHANLNELEPFTEIEPSAENQARWFYDELKRTMPDALAEALRSTRVWETPNQWAQYSEE